ncbi:MAG: lipoate--protein ligase family protein [Candidatus Saganbacteria bacterium]|nr:lipoate--protein ligase family protein [Candidatus Saganbacteria bacterium]
MDEWQLIKTPRLSGQQNMQLDSKMFSDFEEGNISSTLRIYSWNPKCISIGYSQSLDKLIDRQKARDLGFDVVKRPTGGGIVFHNEAEVTYSLVTAIDNPLLPKGLVPSYKKISEAVVFGLGLLGVDARIIGAEGKQETRASLCFSYPAEYEIVVDTKKIVGSAQKRGKKALLQQGSVFVRQTEAKAFSLLKQKQNDLNAISLEEVLHRQISFDELSNALIFGFEEVLGVSK